LDSSLKADLEIYNLFLALILHRRKKNLVIFWHLPPFSILATFSKLDLTEQNNFHILNQYQEGIQKQQKLTYLMKK